MERYMRQTMLPEIGQEGQARLLGSSVLIIGLGGLGAPVAMYLTAAGIGRIGLCDNDVVSLTNLQRQILYAEDELGKRKVECAFKRLSAMSTATVFDCHDLRITLENAAGIISQYDVVMDCTDNFATRRLIDDTCASLGNPWVHGSIDGFIGCVTVFNHSQHKRYTDLYPEATGLSDPKGRIIPTVGPVPGVVGSLQALEAIKLLTGSEVCLDGRILMADMLNMTFDTICF